jgi:hypothetical protein
MLPQVIPIGKIPPAAKDGKIGTTQDGWAICG